MGFPTTIRQGCVVAHHGKDFIHQHIPGAVSFTYKGVELTAVKHTDDIALVLRNAGYDVKAPINYNYQYPGPFKPYEHQQETSGAMSLYPRLHIFDDPGLGKSASAVWAADYLMQQGKVKKTLLVVPLSTMKEAWDKELMQLVPFRSCAILYGSKKKRLKELEKDCDFYIINHAGIKVIYDELKDKGFDLIVFDESTALKNSNTKIWSAVHGLSEGKRLWLMTGTPTPNGPMDAWGQGRLVRPDLLPRTRTRWQQTVMQQITRFKWVPKFDSVSKVHDALQPCVRHTKSECLDLPPVTYVSRKAELEPLQKKALKAIQLQAQFREAAGTSITAVNAAALITKALQIVQGAVINDDGTVTNMGAGKRLKVLKECVDQTDRKVLVFVNYTGVIDSVLEFLEKEGIGAVRIDGNVTKKKRDENFRRFREDPTIKVLVAHPQTTAHGLTLVEADTTVWYGPIYNAEYYEQANNRMNRPGQHHPMTVIHIYCASFEKQVYSHLRGKLDYQSAILGAIEDLI